MIVSQTVLCPERGKKLAGERLRRLLKILNATASKRTVLASRGLSATCWCAVLMALLLAVSGCERKSTAAKTNGGGYSSSQWSEDLFNFAIANLNQLEDNDCQEMAQSMERRWLSLQQPNLAPGAVPTSPLLASWPEPDMLRQVVTRLNQWVDAQGKPASGERDKMLASLSPAAAKLPMVAELDESHFSSYDGYMLMEAVWSRDAARWAKGSTSDDLVIAGNVFDWVVRNIQLDYDRPDHVPQVPWETLFTGHGTAQERAWTYILLLRQLGIEAAVLALPVGETAAAGDNSKDGKGPSDSKSKAEMRPWCVAVLLGDKEKKLHLFDPQLGLPVPAPKGISAGKAGQLEVQPATFEQVVQHPELLDHLARDADRPNWARKADLKRAVAMLEASPMYLEPRAKRIAASLAGERKMVLSVEPSEQKEHFEKAGIGDVRLWDLPYTTLERRMSMTPEAATAVLERFFRYIGLGGGSLYKGRILHLKGKFFDEKGAIAYYQKARPRTRTVLEKEAQRAEETAKFWETDQKGPMTKERKEEYVRRAVNIAKIRIAQILQGRVDAAYWLGLIEYEQDEYVSAVDYFVKRVLQAADPTRFWEGGAHYNIARCLEMHGKWQEAVKEYETNLILRNDDGCLLRARWLKEAHGEQAEKSPPNDKAVEDKSAKKTESSKSEGPKADEKKADKAAKSKSTGKEP